MGIDLLGPLQVDGARPLEPRDRVALTVLALTPGRVIAPEEFAEAIWGDGVPSSWPKQVQICIARLRKVLGAQAIQTVSGGYRLAVSDDAFDSRRFEQLVTRAQLLAASGEPDRAASTYLRALALWRGPPFGDLEDWVPARSETTRLEEMHRTAQEDLLEARLATGEHRQVAVEAEAAVLLEPLRERRWAILATAQYRGGRQGDALRSLRTARQTLRDRLGVDPGRELVELESAILHQDPDLLEVPTVGPATQACPYQGLAPFDVDDAEGFFGRDRDVTTCLERLASTHLLVVAGPSGSGKSSLARAGIVPALATSGRRAVVLVPGEDPVTALAEAVRPSRDPVVLVIDQFEEVFTLESAEGAARAFCLQVADHAQQRAPVVIVVRSDHLGRLAVTPELGRLVERGLFLVPPLAGDSLRMAIEAPALIGGLRLEPGLTDLLVRDCEGEPGSLPLLSHALAETWHRRDGNVLTVEAYRSAGGIRGAVARTADRLYDSLPTDDRAVVRSVLLRLVAAPAQGAPFRRRIPMRGLLADPQRARVVGLLVRSRLVTIDEDTVEVAHEALARAWPRLRTWLEEDVAGQQVLGHLATAADGWDSLGRPDSELYRGARLQAALECRTATTPDLTDVEDAFLAASASREQSEARELVMRAARDARANRRLRDLLARDLVGALAGQITGYDLDTLEPISTFSAARGEVNSLQFSADATTLLATSNDQTVSVYDVASGTQLGDPIPAVAPFIIPGSLRPDGLALAVTGQDGVTIWDLDPASLLAAACTLAGRNLTQIEWATHLGDIGPYRTTCPAPAEPL